MAEFNAFVYPLDRDGGDHPVLVRVSYDCDYEPEFISGLPENCYPASGDMTLTKIEPIGKLPSMLTEGDVLEAADAARDRLEEEAWDHFHTKGVDDVE